MAGDDVGAASERPEESLEGWLDAKAEELDVSREELLARLRTGDAPDGAAVGPGGAALRREFAERLANTQADVEEELTDVREEFDEKLKDVRDRVIQVKREADEKAPADHDHPDLRERTEAVADRADRLAEELESLSETVAEVDERVEAGFDNYEDVLDYLTEATDDLEAKLSTLARVTVELRDQTETLSARHASRAAADELAHLANRRGVRAADCGHCGETVHIGLLAEPKCPHCASQFSDVEPKQGLFGSAKLVVGDSPALEGQTADWDVESVLEADSDSLGETFDELLEDEE